MRRNLARFQAGALAIRPTTSWTRPTMGGRVKSAFGGIKRRAKGLLARPGIKNAMTRIGNKTGSAVGWARRKTGFNSSYELAEFRRKRRFRGRRRRKPTASGHAGKGAALGGALGGAGAYYINRRLGLSHNNALGGGVVEGALGGAALGGLLGATHYADKRINKRRD